jgi:hypothetical protein
VVSLSLAGTPLEVGPLGGAGRAVTLNLKPYWAEGVRRRVLRGSASGEASRVAPAHVSPGTLMRHHGPAGPRVFTRCGWGLL